MKNLLFVDDEPMILEGLRNLLRRYRPRWNMVFASSAIEALAACEQTEFDIVVSDMRMPGDDPAEPLEPQWYESAVVQAHLAALRTAAYQYASYA